LFKAQIPVLAALLSVIFAAWGWLFYQHWQMASLPMSQMWMPPSEMAAWRFTDFALVYSMWAVMMAAMMLPSAIPMILAFHRVCRQRTIMPYQLSYLFTLAYLLIWFLFSSVLTLLQWQCHGWSWLSPMMDNQSTVLAVGVLLLAGIYQFMPIKNACLTHCKSPMGFLLNEWREGASGALVMGFRHGATCLGCCWAQMLVMFAVGIMNLPGMALITLLVIVEKWLPVKSSAICKAGGVIFIVWGALLWTFQS
jgi:predicted metal-binding membrane protein